MANTWACRLSLVHKTTSLSWILHILVGLVARPLYSSRLALIQRCFWEEILPVQQECLPCVFLLLGFLQPSWRHCFQDGVLKTVAADKTNPKPALLCAAPAMQVSDIKKPGKLFTRKRQEVCCTCSGVAFVRLSVASYSLKDCSRESLPMFPPLCWAQAQQLEVGSSRVHGDSFNK